jgi:hypothetical protein
MATSLPNSNLISLTEGSRASVPARTKAAPRMLSPEAGRAVEMLGHAIEYLADEFALDCMGRAPGTGDGLHPQLQAIELLKSRNREIYLSCPVAPTMSGRIRSWFGRKS